MGIASEEFSIRVSIGECLRIKEAILMAKLAAVREAKESLEQRPQDLLYTVSLFSLWSVEGEHAVGCESKGPLRPTIRRAERQ